MVTYEIRKGEKSPCELWSVVFADEDVMVGEWVWHSKGFRYENFVCEGTYTYCERIKEGLIKK